MKKQIFLVVAGLFFLLSFSSCLWNHHDTSVSLSDSGEEYRMKALYERKKTFKIQEFLDSRLEHNGTSFRNTKTNTRITLDDGTTFYMKSYPGKLKIEFNKTENSEEAYYKIKGICEDIKSLLAENSADR